MRYEQRGLTPTTRSRKEALREVVRDRVVDDVPAEAYYETDRIVPFQHDTTRSTIASALLEFVTGEPRTYAVYVLECLQSKTNAGTVLRQGVSPASVTRYEDASDSRRTIYVGMAKQVINRVDQHLNKPGRQGANFTALYPPVRILQVGWFNDQDRTHEAEQLTAEILEEKFPTDFIAQPG